MPSMCTLTAGLWATPSDIIFRTPKQLAKHTQAQYNLIPKFVANEANDIFCILYFNLEKKKRRKQADS